MKYPKISIITPSFNQAEFIEETIKSVLSQKYPNLEYWVIDGGSTDGTLEILEKYSDKLSYISEKDKGQTDAINKGLRRSTGDILAFLNSDDLYQPHILHKVADLFIKNDPLWLVGNYKIINKKGDILEKESFITKYKKALLNHHSYRLLKLTNYIPQPSVFFSKLLIQKLGNFDESLHYTMDYDYWLRATKLTNPLITKKILSAYRVHLTSKSTTQYNRMINEELQVLKNQGAHNLEVLLHSLHSYFALTIYNLIR